MSTRKKVTIDFALADELGFNEEDKKQIRLLFDNDARKLEDIINARSHTDDAVYALRLTAQDEEITEVPELDILNVKSSKGAIPTASIISVARTLSSGESAKYQVVASASQSSLNKIIPGSALKGTWADLPVGGSITGVTTNQIIQVAYVDANGNATAAGRTTISAATA